MRISPAQSDLFREAPEFLLLFLHAPVSNKCSAPAMRLEMELAADPDFTQWTSDSIKSVLPEMRKLNVLHDKLGDVETLEERLQNEVAESNTVAPWIGLVGAWCRKPVV